MNPLSGISYGSQLSSAAAHYNLDPALLAAVAAQETGGPGQTSGRNIVGDGGHGHGLLQIDDRYHTFASTPAAMDPQANANYAAGLLSNLLQQYGGNVREALSAYNSGSPTATGTVTDWGNGQQLGYADSVLRHYDQIAAMTTAGSNGGSVATAAAPAAFAAAAPSPSPSAGPLAILASIGAGTSASDPASMIAAFGAAEAAASGTGGQLGSAGGSSAGLGGSLSGAAPAGSVPASGVSGAATSSDSGSAQMLMLEQMMQNEQQAAPTTTPYESWSQLTAPSTQVSAQADLLMADLGDPPESATANDQG